MKIGIEATSAFTPQRAGVGSYTYHLIRSLAELPDRSIHYTLYTRQPSPSLAELLNTDARNVRHFQKKTLSAPYLWAQVRLPLELWAHPQQVYFFPAPVLPVSHLPARSVMTVHDVAFLFFQDCFAPLLRRWLTLATRLGLRKVQKIIAVSEATRQDILTYYDVAPEKIEVIHHGVHPMFTPLEAEVIEPVKKKYQIETPYLLCVGTLQRRKNIPRLLQAFYTLKQQVQVPHKLVLVGQKYPDLPEHEIFATIERLFLQKEVIWTGYVPGHDIPALMNGADLFVLPSLYEGFGMPVLEAMACGTPVACSNTSSLPEVLGESGLLFDPYSIESIVETLSDYLKNETLRAEYAAKGIARARQFSWDTCARKTLNVLKSVANM